MRLIVVSFIFIGTSISALWIIVANGFMQNPVGYELLADGTGVKLVSFKELMTNPYAWYILVHTLTSCYLLAGFLSVSISAYKLRTTKSEVEKEAFTLAARVGFISMLILSLAMPAVGFSFMKYTSSIQPEKISAISGEVPFVYVSFVLMVSTGTIMILLGLYGTIFFNKFLKSAHTNKIYQYLFALPFIAITAGWIVTEVGRQPWAVYGLLKTEDAISEIPVASVWFSLITITIMYLILFIACIYLVVNRVKKDLEYTPGGVE